MEETITSVGLMDTKASGNALWVSNEAADTTEEAADNRTLFKSSGSDELGWF